MVMMIETGWLEADYIERVARKRDCLMTYIVTTGCH